MTFERHIPATFIAMLLLSGCANTLKTAPHEDDVYFMPSQAAAAASASVDDKAKTPSPQETAAPGDDYYDEGTSQKLGTDRSYYDMAYNDPYYYNYGRFGFGAGWQTGWNGPGWGMGMGYGWGSPGFGWNNGWNNGWNSGWNSPWGYGNSWGWSQPYGWGSDGWGYGGYSGWGWNNWGGYYGNYWSPMGPCHSCYSPIIIGGSSYVGHRVPSNRASSGSSAFGPRIVRDPVSLSPPTQRQQGLRPLADPMRQAEGAYPRERVIQPRTREDRPVERTIERKPTFEPARERQPERNRDFQNPMERSSPSPRDGGGSSPSRHRSR